MKRIIMFGLSGKTRLIATKAWNFVNKQPNTIFSVKIKDGPMITTNLKIYKKLDTACIFGPFSEKGNIELRFKTNEKQNFLDTMRSLGKTAIIKPYLTIISNNSLNNVTAAQK